MKDLFKNYHKHKVLSNLGILGVSAILAVSVNMFVLSWSTGEALKANVLEATVEKVNTADFVAVANSGSVKFSNAQKMQEVTELSFSLAYNSELLTFGEYSSEIGSWNISLIENSEGFSTFLMNFTTPVNIPGETQILTLEYEKSSQETAYINTINVNFTDTDNEKYILSTQGIIF